MVDEGVKFLGGGGGGGKGTETTGNVTRVSLPDLGPEISLIGPKMSKYGLFEISLSQNGLKSVL